MIANEAAHDDCWTGAPCEANDPAHCPKEPARKARAGLSAPAWGELVRREGEQGRRHYLDGLGVHCGDVLELQDVEDRSDDFGEYSVRLGTGVRVRYEVEWSGKGPDPVVVLYARVGGHSFRCVGESWMRFRWPRKS